jgi:hypothetical protein
VTACQHRVVTLLAVAVLGIGSGCSHGGSSERPLGPGGGGGGKNNTAPIVTIGKDSGCYADNAWVPMDSKTTVQWNSSGEEYTVLFNPASIPLVDASGKPAPPNIDVPAGTTSATFTLNSNAYAACQSGSNPFACYYPYMIAVTKPSSITDTCGPSPMTVGIHIKP